MIGHLLLTLSFTLFTVAATWQTPVPVSKLALSFFVINYRLKPVA